MSVVSFPPRRRERPGAALLREGESDADAFLAQGELEMKKGSDGRRCLFYLDKAVELNDYDEEVKSTIIINCLFNKLNYFYFKGLHSQEQVRISDFIMIQLTKTKTDLHSDVIITSAEIKKQLRTHYSLLRENPFQVKYII